MNGIVTLLPGEGTTSVSKAPTVTGVAVVNSTTVRVSYSPPPTFFSGPVNSYSAISSPSNITTTTTSTSDISVSGLQPFVCYTFRVSASNVYGNSPYSAASPVFRFDVPSAPNITNIFTCGSSVVKVSGSIPTIIGPCGLPITTVSAVSTPGCITTTTNLTGVGAFQLGYSIYCFVSCGIYTFQLYASNPIGPGNRSASSTPIKITPPRRWTTLSVSPTVTSALTAIPIAGGRYLLAFVSNASIPSNSKWYLGPISSLQQLSATTSYFSVPEGILFNNRFYYGYWYCPILVSGSQPDGTVVSTRSLIENFDTMVADNLFGV